METAKTISVSTKNKNDDDDKTEISIKEFLSFLKTAYQVQDTLEGVLTAGGMTDAVNWLKLKESEMVKPKNIEEKKDTNKKKHDDGDPVKQKLSEVLCEGILDSVLPYLIPNSPQNLKSKSQIKIIPVDKSTSQASIMSKKKANDSTNMSKPTTTTTKTESEVEIHVCDEVKNLKKEFYCNQALLTDKMGYFAEVTAGQKLEDMDISVHCDIGIFEWLMKWVKKESLLEEDWPQLDPQCVVPVLVSAAFLQMEPLLNDCLLFCHEHMNDILKTSTNLSCINDSVLTRLAAMYTNVELEAIRDRKDKIQSRIFAKLIMSLAEIEPESVRGHWMSLARIFRCLKCQQLVNPQVGPLIPCVPSCMRLQWDGSVVSNHVRDPAWNINEYILKLHKNLKTWRRVYWRLWSDAHFLYCVVCKKFFPVNQIGWCRFHPDTPQYFTLDAQRAPLPVGRYSCCGERAYRFQLLNSYSGCQFREHQVSTQDVRDSAIMTLLDAYRIVIEEHPPQLLFPERLTRLVARDTNDSDDGKLNCKETFWWEGFEVVPPRPKMGLLSNFINKTDEVEEVVEILPLEEFSSESDSESSCSSTESSSSAESVESNTKTIAKKTPTPRRKKPKAKDRFWQHDLSSRCNQDNQRAYEEGAMKKMITVLKRKTNLSDGICRISGSKKGLNRNTNPLGGVWARLENEWRETISFTPQNKTKTLLCTNPKSRILNKK